MYLKLFSQTLDPNDDPEDGTIVGFCIYDGDTPKQAWSIPETGDSRANSLLLNSTGELQFQVQRKNLTFYDITPPPDKPEALAEMVDTLLQDGCFVEVDANSFTIVLETPDATP